jgi:hypothetical protein
VPSDTVRTLVARMPPAPPADEALATADVSPAALATADLPAS